MTIQKRPNWKTIGTVKFNGVEGYISGWTKTAKNGNEYISIVFEEKSVFESKSGAKPQPKADTSDDLPF